MKKQKIKEKVPVSDSKSLLLEWLPDDPILKKSKVILFDGLLVIVCYQTGNGDWESYAFGAENEDINFGYLFATEYDARKAAENWLLQSIKALI